MINYSHATEILANISGEEYQPNPKLIEFKYNRYMPLENKNKEVEPPMPCSLGQLNLFEQST